MSRGSRPRRSDVLKAGRRKRARRTAHTSCRFVQPPTPTIRLVADRYRDEADFGVTALTALELKKCACARVETASCQHAARDANQLNKVPHSTSGSNS